MFKINEKILNEIRNIFEDYEFFYLELPLFNRDKKRIKRNQDISFGGNKSVNISGIEDEDLYEFDEKIFYGILTLANIQESEMVITDFPEIIRISGINYNGNTMAKLKETMKKISKCTIKTNNMKMYGEISGSNEIKLVDEYEVIDCLNKENKEKYHSNIRNNKIHTLLKIKIPYKLYQETRKLDITTLFMIEGITKKRLYILMKIWEVLKKNDNEVREIKILKLFCLLPLKIDSKNLSAMYDYLEYKFQIIKEMRIIYEYKINGNKNILEDNITYKIVKSENLMNDIKENSKKKLENYELGLYEQEILYELNLLKKIMGDLNKIVKTLDFDKCFYKNGMLTIVYEKLHTIKGLAGFIENNEMEKASEKCKKIISECFHDKNRYFVTANNEIITIMNKMFKLTKRGGD